MIQAEQSIYCQKVKRFETDLIVEALSKSGGNQARAARLLGLSPTTLSSQLRRLGIRGRDFKNSEALTTLENFQRLLLWKSRAPHSNVGSHQWLVK
jgi:hypothetical protein